MKKEQLVMYARNHAGSLYNSLLLVVAFLALKYQMYGAPTSEMAYVQEAGILLFCFLLLLRQQRMYKKIMEAKLKDSDCGGYVGSIAINRMLYLLPWLALMFQPLHAQYVTDHLIGYLFVFCVTAAYASSSAPILFLHVYDIALPGAYAVVMTLINWHVQETPYLGIGVFAFCLYGLISGRKIRQSTLQLIDSKHEMALSARRADDANRAKSSFLALMSHEIRTPMTGIFGMIDFLKETKLDDEQRDFLNTISDCSKTLLNTLNDILDFSKVESGKMTISEIDYDFHTMLAHSARLLRQIAEDKGLELNVDIGPDVPHRVHGDPHRVQQIVVNLINNAVKFTEKGSVTLRATHQAGKPPILRIEVADTGIGISKENIGKLFSAFSQADNSISRKYGGSGLGLSIAKRLVELMGGKIGVNSDEGKGSAFWFELPCQPPVSSETEAAAEEQSREVAPQEILVVEDNPVNERIITKMLEHKGHKVTAVTNGDDAIKAVQEKTFNLVFMDVNMPGKNGLDTTRAIRAMGGRFAKMPIVGLTANIMEEFVRKCLDAGMAGHVAKPFTPKTLYDAVAQYTAGPGAAPAKKAPFPRRKTMRETLAAVRDGMGIDYMRSMIASNLKEVDRLMARTKEEFDNNRLDAMGDMAHDLKSISGLIGMNNTSGLAAAIESDCLKGDGARLPDLLDRLGQARQVETNEAERLSSTMPPE